MEMDEKNKKPGVNVTKASYVTCGDHNVLDLFVDRQYIPKKSVSDVTEENVNACIDKLAKRDTTELDLADVEKAISHVRIKMNIPWAEPRIDIIILDYKRALEAAGYPNFSKDCPKLVIRHIFDWIKPQILKEIMEDEFEKQDSKALRKKCFITFLSVLTRLADTVEKIFAEKIETIQTLSVINHAFFHA